MTHFEKEIEVRWSDCDANSHVRHSAYYDYGAYVRIRFFAESGFDSKAMQRLGIGPVIFKEECSFIRELRLEDNIRVNVLKGPVKEDASKWVLHHEIFNEAGTKCAHIILSGAWLDLHKRKLTIPPKALAKAIHGLQLGEAYIYKKSK